jgi:hypothetical protein
MNNVRIERNGRLIQIEDVKESEVIVAGGATSDPERALVFDTEDAYRTWAASVPIGEHYMRLDMATLRFRALEDDAGDERARIIHRRRLERLREDFDDLRARLGENTPFAELFAKASYDAPLLEGPILDSMTLHHRTNLGGDWVPIHNYTPISNLGWIDFDNRTTSVLIHGVGVLARYTRFRGRKLYLAGFPVLEYPDLKDFNFNNLASSAAVKGVG